MAFTIALLLSVPAGAEESAARVKSAVAALGAVELRGMMLAPWPGADGVWVAAALSKDTDPVMRVALLAAEGEGFRLLAAGEAEPLTVEPPWSWELRPAAEAWAVAPGWRAVGVVLRNSYTSTARSAFSDALHLFRQDGAVLRPVFAGMVRRQSYDRSEAEECVTRRGFAQPGAAGRQAPARVRDACERANDTMQTWKIAPGPVRHMGVAELVVRARGRVVGRARWTGQAYSPARISPDG